MHRNIFLGITAWLLGAATATAGCLLAVSLLGSGINGGSGQLLSQEAASRELASDAPRSASDDAPSPAASVDPDPTLASMTPTPVPSTSSPAPSPTASATQGHSGTGSTESGDPGAGATPTGTAMPGGTVLASSAGDVVATCQAAEVYLISWSPTQGYEVDEVFRGPAMIARVTFESHADQVTMTVSCSGGVPSATTRSQSGGDE